MNQEKLISLLSRSSGYVSGQEMSQALGVTRGAVWKELSILRDQGWPISSSTRLGYRLDGPPPFLSAPYLDSRLQGTIFSGHIHVFPQLASTNTYLKTLATQGAPHGTVVAALEQTEGRGTRGRSFSSPPGGLYLSLLLRPAVTIEQLFSLTGWVAVAVRRAIETACGAPVEIKWLNDIYLNGKKLCGILTELSLLGESSEPDYVVIGVGMNLSQSTDTFRTLGLDEIASSLSVQGYPVEPNHMAITLLQSLQTMVENFPHQRDIYLTDYRAHCLTLHQCVEIEGEDPTHFTTAQDILPDFSLQVMDQQGVLRKISSGRVTPHSLYPRTLIGGDHHE